MCITHVWVLLPHAGSVGSEPRSPLAAADLQEQGLACLYDNAQLAAWADVLFLCCLPSHLAAVCSTVRIAIRKPCVVYSLVTAVPLPR